MGPGASCGASCGTTFLFFQAPAQEQLATDLEVFAVRFRGSSGHGLNSTNVPFPLKFILSPFFPLRRQDASNLSDVHCCVFVFGR